MGIIHSGPTWDHKQNPASPTYPSDPTYQVTYGSLVTQAVATIPRFSFPRPVSWKPVVDLRIQGCAPYMKVQSQDILSNCSSQAVTAAFQCLERKNHLPFLDPSVLFNYTMARTVAPILMNQSNLSDLDDTGTSVISALVAGQDRGFVSEAQWPTTAAALKQVPDSNLQILALQNRILQWNILDPSLDNLKACLDAGYPFLVEIIVTKAMDQWFRNRNSQVASQFLLAFEEITKSSIIAAHTVLCVAYDSGFLGVGGFCCRNSWGTEFGDQGHFWISFSDMLYPDLIPHLYVIRDICVGDCPGIHSTCYSAETCHQITFA